MKFEFKTTKFDVEIYGLTEYLNVGDVVYDTKVERIRKIFWNIDVITLDEGIDEIRFGVDGIFLSFYWEIPIMQLEEYESMRLEKNFDAFIGRDDVFGAIIIDKEWDIEFPTPKELSAPFEFRPELVVIYVNEKKVVIS